MKITQISKKKLFNNFKIMEEILDYDELIKDSSIQLENDYLLNLKMLSSLDQDLKIKIPSNIG